MSDSHVERGDSETPRRVVLLSRLTVPWRVGHGRKKRHVLLYCAGLLFQSSAWDSFPAHTLARRHVCLAASRVLGESASRASQHQKRARVGVWVAPEHFGCTPKGCCSLHFFSPPPSLMSSWELKPHPVIPKGKPVLVCILDGFGENEIKDEYNAVFTAKTPTIDKLRESTGRFRTVKAHGPAVGLPTWDDMGNSEVGHNALGAGQLIEQGARLVDKALSTGSLYENDGWKYISSAFEKNTVHFIGLLSSGGVHSRQDQLEHCAWARLRISLTTSSREL